MIIGILNNNKIVAISGYVFKFYYVDNEIIFYSKNPKWKQFEDVPMQYKIKQTLNVKLISKLRKQSNKK